MRRTARAIAALISATGSGAVYGNQQWFVDVGGSELAFSPSSLTISAGDSVTFRNLGGLHNVVADDGSFRCAHGCDGEENGNGAASSSIWIATVSFQESGTVGYFCEVHGQPGQGMFGTVTVTPTKKQPTIIEVPTVGAMGGLVLGLFLIFLRITRIGPPTDRKME